jgi:hypothetical protein
VTLVLRNIVDAGLHDKERLILRATENVDLGDYAILVVGEVNPEELSTRVQFAFWFPYKPIKKDELVVVYTKAGQPREKALTGGGATHFYYWDLEDILWDTASQRNAVLLHSPKWTSKNVSELTGTKV